MRAEDRHTAYKKYIKLSEQGKNAEYEDLINALMDSFDVSEQDIADDIDDIVKKPGSASSLEQSVQMRRLMEDLRDYRDISEINKHRNDILRDAYTSTDKKDNEVYIFPL